MRLIIFLIFLDPTFNQSLSKVGPYYATLIGMTNHHGNASLVKSYFYLQRLNRTTIVMRGVLNTTIALGPLWANITMAYHTSNGLRKVWPRPTLYPGCIFPGSANTLKHFEPQNVIQWKNCTIPPGHYEIIDLDFNALMQQSFATRYFARYLIQVDFVMIQRSGQSELAFGFDLDILFEDKKLVDYRLSKVIEREEKRQKN